MRRERKTIEKCNRMGELINIIFMLELGVVLDVTRPFVIKHIEIEWEACAGVCMSMVVCCIVCHCICDRKW